MPYHVIPGDSLTYSVVLLLMQNLESLLTGSHSREWSDRWSTHILISSSMIYSQTWKQQEERVESCKHHGNYGTTFGTENEFLVWFPGRYLLYIGHADSSKFHNPYTKKYRINGLGCKVDQHTCKICLLSKMVFGVNILPGVNMLCQALIRWCRSIRSLNVNIEELCMVQLLCSLNSMLKPVVMIKLPLCILMVSNKR